MRYAIIEKHLVYRYTRNVHHKLFLMLLTYFFILNQNNDASELLNSDLFNFYQDVQPLQKVMSF